MKIFIKILIVVIIVLIAAPILAYKYFFAGSPRDLGIKYTTQNYTDAHQKVGVEVVKLNNAASPKDSLQFSGKKEINVSLDSSESTAYLNAETWKYSPLSNLQVKINQNGTAEASGVLHLNNVLPFISMTTPTDEVDKAIKKFNIPSNPPFYAVGSVQITNNKVSFNVTSLEIGRIPVPAKYISENLNAINKFGEDRLLAVPNLMVRSFSLSGGKANIDATVPTQVAKLFK